LLIICFCVIFFVAVFLYTVRHECILSLYT
jgi:hypothetical protein